MKGILTTLSAALASVLLLTFCTGREPVISSDPEFNFRKHKMDSIATNAASTDELNDLVKASVKTGDDVAAMCFYRELGKRNRDSSDFQAAIYCHGEALDLAKKLKDTVSIINMLNQQGTDYRRTNAHDLASDCYYEAIRYSDEYEGEQSYTFLRNKVASLNGLGNIFKDIDQEERAEGLFREALNGEQALNNHLGMAINTANLGSICEHRDQLDSALYYYRRSFEENTIAKSVLGVALCYNHFGRIHEKKGQLDSSLVNYQKAYTSLGKDADKWHWLASCISLARIHYRLGHNSTAKVLLDEALETAGEIDSWYHLSEIYDLRSAIFKDEGQWKNALEDLSHATMFKDSLEYENQMNHVTALQNEYQEKQSEAALQQERLKTLEENHEKKLILWISIILLALLLVIVRLLMYSLKMRNKNFEAKMSVEKTRQEFFTNVTHDFRTPLTVILGQARLICSRNENNKDVESAEAIIRQSDILMELINQILDISKVKSSVGNADWRRGNILPLLSMTVENARLSANAKNISIYYSHSSELDGTEIDFIPDFTRKIFSNILSNAVKYTKEGGEISVEASTKGDRFIWKATDTGIGIRKDELDKIFIPFFRSDSAQKQTGNGIGLSLVKQMVEAMDGQVEVDSIEGKGTTFTVSIPVQHFKMEEVQPYFHPHSGKKENEAVPQSSGTETVEEDDSNAEKPIVLIVEDNSDIAGYISELLKDQYQIKTALNGRIGLSVIEEYVPDLIITDLMMPDIDGLELCRRVRASEMLNHIPLVVVTAKDREADRLAGIEAGADAFIIKPFNAQELIMVVQNLLESRRLLREKYSTEIKGTDDISSVTVNNPETDQFLSKLTSAILSDLASPELSAEYIADKLCLSPSSVNRKIKSITGMSTSAFITATKVSMAKKMLSTTDKSIGEISDLCGFEYQSYFTRIFKNQTGLTPVEYRNSPKKA